MTFFCYFNISNFRFTETNLLFTREEPKAGMLATVKFRSFCLLIYTGADKSLARSEKKQANVSVKMASISFGALPCREKKFHTSRLDVVEIARVPDMLPSVFPSCSG